MKNVRQVVVIKGVVGTQAGLQWKELFTGEATHAEAEARVDDLLETFEKVRVYVGGRFLGEVAATRAESEPERPSMGDKAQNAVATPPTRGTVVATSAEDCRTADLKTMQKWTRVWNLTRSD